MNEPTQQDSPPSQIASGFADGPPNPENPLLEHLGIELVEVQSGRAVFSMDITPKHLNRQGSLQGGVYATLLDVACGYAGLAASDDEPLGNAVTVTLNISYLGKVSSGRVLAIGTVTRMGRSMYFATGELQTEAGTVVATAQAAFKRSRAK
ncbi:PaaI family thioesterase [Bordetella genomosp. 12]|uniref:PaaI family thioesterase n=1 Tax=Bordetella genomosp. 12 TaxID=463035 RepID=UPI001FC976D9|nr:PaaI family thioesterase [Bordetella genomosp. 12]